MIKKSGQIQWKLVLPALFFFTFGGVVVSCSLTHSRPVQLMADTHAAIEAAREVQADVLAPELFRQATEWFHRAREDYRIKNFAEAEESAQKARAYAERAEFEAIRSGANRESIEVSDPMESKGSRSIKPMKPNAYPTPEGTPIEAFDNAPDPKSP